MDLNSIINSASQTYGVSPSLITSVIEHESSGNPTAISPTGAMGLMQLEPGTAKEMGVTDPFDPTDNIFGGTKYLASLIKEFGGDIASALAAYNWGPGNVKKGTNWPSSVAEYVNNVLAGAGLSNDSGQSGSIPSLDLVLIGGVLLSGLIVWWLL